MKQIDDILENWDKIMEEYNTVTRTIPLPDFTEDLAVNPDWRAIALWWNGKPGKSFQSKMPFTTELMRNGPTHQATGWLMLRPHSRTQEHDHAFWGARRIIVHIPTYIPEGDLGFVVDGNTYRWKMGEVYAFDGNKRHYGYNNTDETRSIMVFDYDYHTYYDQLKKYMHE